MRILCKVSLPISFNGGRGGRFPLSGINRNDPKNEGEEFTVSPYDNTLTNDPEFKRRQCLSSLLPICDRGSALLSVVCYIMLSNSACRRNARLLVKKVKKSF
jgi:hypothetical protein